jgi:hypothetical protein
MKPSVPVILWNDWPTLASWVGVVVGWALYGGFTLLKVGQHSAHFLAPLVAATLVLLALLAWRIGRVHRLFARGKEVPGEITGLWLHRDRGRLEFCYRVGEAQCHCWAPVHKTARVLAFAEGQPVRVLVDPANPRQAIVRDLYAQAAVLAASGTRSQ